MSVGSLVGDEATVSSYPEYDRIMLKFKVGDSISLPAESWAAIIPELVAALPDPLRDDMANAICATACGAVSA